MKTLKNNFVMKLRSLFILSILALAATGINAQTKMPSAEQVLKQAYQKAAKEKKNVFLIFHASWCGWCHKMDTAMSDPAIKPFFNKNYVITHLTVLEADDKKNLENPGAADLLTKYGADKQGIPFWLVFDKDGKVLADSKLNGSNTGCPASAGEVAYFIEVLKKTSTLSAGDQAAIEKRFRKNEQGR